VLWIGLLTGIAAGLAASAFMAVVADVIPNEVPPLATSTGQPHQRGTRPE
jgi:hypothetical protein